MPRPKSENPSAAALRKRRQLERQKAEGRGLVLITPSPEVMDGLAKLNAVTGRGMKREAEAVLRRAVGTALGELRTLAATYGPVYAAVLPFIPYADYLRTPDAKVRIGDRELRGSDYLPLAEKLGVFRDWARRQGWGIGRVRAFLEAAAAGRLELSWQERKNAGTQGEGGAMPRSPVAPGRPQGHPGGRQTGRS